MIHAYFQRLIYKSLFLWNRDRFEAVAKDLDERRKEDDESTDRGAIYKSHLEVYAKIFLKFLKRFELKDDPKYEIFIF